MANLEDFDALVAELIQTEGQKSEETKKEDGFALHLGGKDYKFASQQEAERAVETHMAQLEQRAREAAAAAAAANQPPPPPAPAPKEGEIDPRVKDFVAALEKGDFKTMSNIMLKHGVFDGKIDDPGAVLTDSLLRTAQLDRGNAVSQFLASHPDLQNNPAAQSTVEQARNFLGLPATPDGFEAAHAYAERRGFIQPGQTPGNQGGYQSNANGNRNVPPPPPGRPATTGSGQPQTPEEWEAFYESRSDAELEKLMSAAYAGRR